MLCADWVVMEQAGWTPLRVAAGVIAAVQQALVDAEAKAQAPKVAQAAVAKQARYHWSSSGELARLASEVQAAEAAVAAARASLAAAYENSQGVANLLLRPGAEANVRAGCTCAGAVRPRCGCGAGWVGC